MQTFLPYAGFAASAATLDRQRLGKQRVETLQIMKALTTGAGWINHPATRMWRGYAHVLMDYQRAVCREWTGRGYRDTCLWKTQDLLDAAVDLVMLDGKPPWLGDEQFHLAHQSNLIRKMPERYGSFFPGVPDDLEYIWPEAAV